jgi:hypothetical protein
MARERNLIGPGTDGLTLGYGVFLKQGKVTPGLWRHEFRHVYQVEQAGSLEVFQKTYLEQVVEVGYLAAPYEVEAGE